MTSRTSHVLLLAASNGTTLIPNFVNIGQYVLKFNNIHMRAHSMILSQTYFTF
jgi:hypothetical protein